VTVKITFGRLLVLGILVWGWYLTSELRKIQSFDSQVVSAFEAMSGRR